MERIEMTVLRRCLADRRILEPQIRDGTIFPSVKDPHVREQIWNNVLSISHPIPSTTGLSKDLKFLGLMAKLSRT